jgi:arabinoxylan arabinofuranohydrolase
MEMKPEARCFTTGAQDITMCDGREWTTLSMKIKRKIDKGVGNIYFVFNGEGFLFDEWKFM